MDLSICPWGRQPEAKQPIQTRHRRIIKGGESIYTSGVKAIKVGSADKGQTGLGRRPKVLARRTVKYCEALALSTVKYLSGPLLNQSGDP
jgi:hypothetical protein